MHPLQCYNCLDRHVEAGLGDRVCFFWEGNDVGQDSVITYKQLLDQVCQVRVRGPSVRDGGRMGGLAGCTRLSMLHPAAEPTWCRAVTPHRPTHALTVRRLPTT